MRLGADPRVSSPRGITNTHSSWPSPPSPTPGKEWAGRTGGLRGRDRELVCLPASSSLENGKAFLFAEAHSLSQKARCQPGELWLARSLGPSPVRKGECPGQRGGRGFCRAQETEGKPYSSHSAASHCGVREAGGERISCKAAVSEGAGASDERQTVVLHLLQKLSSCRPHHPGPPRSGPAPLLVLLKPTSSASLHAGGSEPALSLWDAFPSLPTVSSLQSPARNSSLQWLYPYPSQIPSVVSL